MFRRLGLLLEWMILSIFCITLLNSSAPRPQDEVDRVRAYTRDIEFDYLSWMLNASRLKVQQGTVGIPGYLTRESATIAVSDYLQITQEILRAEDALNRLFADPAIPDKQTASVVIRKSLALLKGRQAALAPIAEGVLQGQVSQVAADFGLTTLGQSIPAILFHSSPVPNALIVSPRDHIEQIANISLVTDFALDRQVALESRVDQGLNVASLVVPIGGVGVYPTMIMQTTDLAWLVSTISHEWTHNYLELRPLGQLYDASPELRTMNETTADISGTEIGAEVMKRYYPGYLGSMHSGPSLATFPQMAPNADRPVDVPFDFNTEMHTTRVTVDAFLAAKKITEAEAYMETRRQIFVQNGYFIRKLNQAYFAFYGAYADVPGGAAGEDPVGPAVRALRSRSKSLADFINRIAWMTSFKVLQEAVGG
jgi:hypothetical protein